VQVVNAIRQAIQQIFNQTSQSSRNGSNGGGGVSALGKFEQQDVTYKTFNIYDPNDNTVYVTVKQVQSVTWKNMTTGQTITYTQPGS
jgi:hypothetical protein